MAYVRDLNVARGWAAAYVAAFHLSLTWPQGGGATKWFVEGLLRYGWTGVDLFFVLSGFVLAAPFLRPGSKAPRYGPFLLRRWLRIAPPYYAAILFALLLVGGWSSLAEPARSLPQLLLFAQNLTPDTLAHVNPVFWTLAIEFQFYLLLPLLVRGFQGRSWTLLLGAMALASLAWRYTTFYGADGQWAPWPGLQLVPFLAHFGLGMGAARLWNTRPALPHAAAWSWLALLLGFALPLALFVPMGDVAQSTDALLPYVVVRPWLALGFAAFVLLRAMHSTSRPVPPRGLPGNFLGDISYSLYLVHLPILLLLRDARPAWPGLSLGWSSVLALGLVFAAAVAFHFAVERPSVLASRHARLRTARAGHRMVEPLMATKTDANVAAPQTAPRSR